MGTHISSILIVVRSTVEEKSHKISLLAQFEIVLCKLMTRMTKKYILITGSRLFLCLKPWRIIEFEQLEQCISWNDNNNWDNAYLNRLFRYAECLYLLSWFCNCRVFFTIWSYVCIFVYVQIRTDILSLFYFENILKIMAKLLLSWHKKDGKLSLWLISILTTRFFMNNYQNK